MYVDLYNLIGLMDNHCRPISVYNDATVEEVYRGSIANLTCSDLWYSIQDEEVTDLYAGDDGVITICYYREVDES